MSEHDDYRDQTERIKRAFDPVLTEPIPARMYLRRPVWMDYAQAASLLLAGIAIGLVLPFQGASPTPQPGELTTPIAVRAARAHAVYVSEVRHPVEVDASQQDHLVKWLSKRLGMDLKVPVLADEGFELLGGRLLPGPSGPVAHFMYQDAAGKRLTLYVSRRASAEEPAAFRFAREGPVSVFYWIDDDCGYALSGDIDKPALARVATSVYRQLEH